MADKFRLNKVISTVQAMLDDPAGLTFDSDYLMPFVNLAWDKISNRFSSLGLTYEEDVEVLNPVTAGTADLSQFQADGGVIAAMLLPTYVEWKRVDDDDTHYAEVKLCGRLPDVNSEAEGHAAYEWRGGVIYLTPSSIDTVVRVRFKTFTVDFSDPSDQIISGVRNVIAHKIVELVCSPTVRSNPDGMKYHAAEYERDACEFESLCVKQKNAAHLRIGRMSGRTRRSPGIVLRAQP